MTIKEIIDGYKKGEFVPSKIVSDYNNNIKAADKNIFSFININKEFESEGLKADVEIKKTAAPLLTGVPIGIKDNIMVKDMLCTCGSKILSNHTSAYNATVVERLKAAGAIIAGKSNLDEFAMGSTTENSAFGPTRNPVDTNYVPGGSSGGSAAAVAAGFVPAALGSDTGGSVRQPASFCGIVGYKPSYGMISRYGLVAFGSSLDQIGTLTNTCEDAALITGIISGEDAYDSTTVNVIVDNLHNFTPIDIKGKKFGLIRETMGKATDDNVKQIISKFAEKIRALGGIVEEITIPQLELGISTYYIIAPAEASSNLARYDGIRYGLRTSRKDVDAKTVFTYTRDEGFGEEVKRRIIMGNFVLSSGYYDAYYKKAQKARIVLAERFNQAFTEYDFLLSPTSPVLPFKLGSTIDDPLQLYAADLCTVPVNLAGLPAVSIPAGKVGKLPVGIQIIAKRFNDGVMLGVGETLMKNIGTV